MRILLTLIFALAFVHCARQGQPTGGPKDNDPPELISSNPKNGAKNFQGNTIELEFNEYVKLKDPKDEILITPSFGPNTRFIVKKNRVIITPENKLLDTTTYSMAFREGIQDINEGNPAEDLHMAFSTGPTIDSLRINGTISETFKENIPEKITIGLYQSDTFDIFKHKPFLFSKSDKKGHFSIPNLKPGKYFVYAFDDKNKNQKVDSKSERYGFSSKEIVLPETKDSIHIDLIRLDARPPIITSVRNSKTVSVIRLNKAVDRVQLSTPSTPLLYTFGDTKSEVILYKDFDKTDSLKINVLTTDSLQQKLDTAVYVKYTDNKMVEEKFKISDWQLNFDPLTNALTAETTINKLLLSINYDSIYIQIDTVNFQPIRPGEITLDTLLKSLRLKTNLNINSKDKIPTPVLLLGKGALVSVNNDSSKSQDLKIRIPKTENTGTVSVDIQTREPHFLINLTTQKDKIVKSIHDTKKITFTHLEPAEYKIVVIIDSNHNQRWDPGNFYERKEPEKVTLYKNIDNKYSFPIRANWELGPLVITF